MSYISSSSPLKSDAPGQTTCPFSSSSAMSQPKQSHQQQPPGAAAQKLDSAQRHPPAHQAEEMQPKQHSWMWSEACSQPSARTTQTPPPCCCWRGAPRSRDVTRSGGSNEQDAVDADEVSEKMAETYRIAFGASRALLSITCTPLTMVRWVLEPILDHLTGLSGPGGQPPWNSVGCCKFLICQNTKKSTLGTRKGLLSKKLSRETLEL